MLKDNILGDGIASIELLNWMGGDLDIVNSARVSYDKQAKEFTEKDEKLVRYLIKHKHNSPLRSTILRFRVVAPIYIVNQYKKHIIASTYIDDPAVQQNQESLRYVKFSGEYYFPGAFRKQDTKNKQSSVGYLTPAEQYEAELVYRTQCDNALLSYEKLISLGVCREQARGVLPESIYTKFIATHSLEACLNFIHLRLGSGAQYEIQKYGQAMLELIKPVAPVAIEEWIRINNEE